MSDLENTIWKKPIDLESINSHGKDVMTGHLGINITEVGPDFIRGSMPVDARTRQIHGILHGGASVVLAETLGSIAGNYCLSDDNEVCVGLSINSSHVRSVSEGLVIGKASPFHIGRSTHVWHIEIRDESEKLVNISRLTLAVIKKP